MGTFVRKCFTTCITLQSGSFIVGTHLLLCLIPKWGSQPSAGVVSMNLATRNYRPFNLLRRFLRICEQYDLVPAEARIAQSMDAQTKRQLKIQRFQRDKQSRVRLKELGRLDGTLEDSREESRGDEDLEREAWLIRIELAVLKAAEQSSQIQQVPITYFSHIVQVLDTCMSLTLVQHILLCLHPVELQVIWHLEGLERFVK